jgi:hypothetical protein
MSVKNFCNRSLYRAFIKITIQLFVVWLCLIVDIFDVFFKKLVPDEDE